MVRFGSKNEYRKDMCLKETRLCDQNMITILNSLFNIIKEDLYDHLMSMRIFTLTINTIMDDGQVHPLTKTLPSLASDL